MAFCLLLPICLNAQTTINGGMKIPDARPDLCMVIPKEYSSGNKPQLTFRNSENRKKVMILNENLDVVKQFDVNENKFEYTLTFLKQERDVNSVTEKDRTTKDLHMSFREWCQQNKNMDYRFDEYMLHISTQENGDSIIYADISSMGSGSNESMYFGYEHFGMKYPKVYWRASKGNMYQYSTSYTVEYTDWHTVSSYDEKHSVPASILHIYNMNLDNGDGNNGSYFDFSQTLFNQDGEYEYIIPKYTMSADGGDTDEPSVSPVEPANDIVLSQTVEDSNGSSPVFSGFQVVSTNGNVVKDLDFDTKVSVSPDMKNVALITIGGNRYLAFGGYSKTVFFKLGSLSSSIERVKTVPMGMRIWKSEARGNATINVSLGNNTDVDSEIVVSSVGGTKISSHHVEAGQTVTCLPLNVLPGVYCVSRMQQGQTCSSQKILVE